MSVSAHKPVGSKYLSMGDDAVVQMVENYSTWKNLCGARHSYDLHDPDSIILGDEMGFPYESLPKYIYDNSWSCGKPVGEVLWEGKTSSQFSFFLLEVVVNSVFGLFSKESSARLWTNPAAVGVRSYFPMATLPFSSLYTANLRRVKILELLYFGK